MPWICYIYLLLVAWPCKSLLSDTCWFFSWILFKIKFIWICIFLHESRHNQIGLSRFTQHCSFYNDVIAAFIRVILVLKLDRASEESGLFSPHIQTSFCWKQNLHVFKFAYFKLTVQKRECCLLPRPTHTIHYTQKERTGSVHYKVVKFFIRPWLVNPLNGTNFLSSKFNSLLTSRCEAHKNVRKRQLKFWKVLSFHRVAYHMKQM